MRTQMKLPPLSALSEGRNCFMLRRPCGCPGPEVCGSVKCAILLPAQMCMFAGIPVRLWREGACHIQAIALCLTALDSFATLIYEKVDNEVSSAKHTKQASDKLILK